MAQVMAMMTVDLSWREADAWKCDDNVESPVSLLLDTADPFLQYLIVLLLLFTTPREYADQLILAKAKQQKLELQCDQFPSINKEMIRRRDGSERKWLSGSRAVFVLTKI